MQSWLKSSVRLKQRHRTESAGRGAVVRGIVDCWMPSLRPWKGDIESPGRVAILRPHRREMEGETETSEPSQEIDIDTCRVGGSMTVSPRNCHASPCCRPRTVPSLVCTSGPCVVDGGRRPSSCGWLACASLCHGVLPPTNAVSRPSRHRSRIVEKSGCCPPPAWRRGTEREGRWVGLLERLLQDRRVHYNVVHELLSSYKYIHGWHSSDMRL